MPHLTIEYSKNIENDIEINDLVQAMHNSAASIDALPIGGLRTRAVARKHFLVADGHSSNTFVNVALRIAPGRSEGIKKEASFFMPSDLPGAILKATFTNVLEE